MSMVGTLVHITACLWGSEYVPCYRW